MCEVDRSTLLEHDARSRLTFNRQVDHAPFNKMGSRLWQRKLSWRGGRGQGGAGEEAERAAGPMLEMRTLGSGGGFVDPHY